MIVYTKISKNLLSLLIGKSLELIITLVSITLIARYLGVEKYGLFISIVALTYLISKVIDFGLAPIVFRENSKLKVSDSLINTAFTLRIIFFFVLLISFNIISPFTNLTNTEIIYSNILFLNIIFSAKYMNFRELLEIEFKVNHNMFYVVVFNAVDSLLLLSFVILMPFVNGNLEYLVFGYVISNLPGFLGLIIYLKKKYGYTFKFNLSQAAWLMREAFPLYGTVILTALFQQADILFLRSLDTTHAVGIYAAAIRLTTPLGIIPLALITTVFPIIVKNRENGTSVTKLTTNLVYKTLFLFAFSISLVVSFKAKIFVSLIFGEMYIEAYLPMIILFWSFLFVYFNTFTLNLLTAFNLQKYNFFFTLILVVINFALIFLLVSDFSYVGTAIAKLGAGFAGSLFFVLILNKSQIHYKFYSLRIFLWSVLTLLIIFILSYLPIYIYVFLALVTVAYLTLKIKFYTMEELDTILNIINKSSWKEKILKII